MTRQSRNSEAHHYPYTGNPQGIRRNDSLGSRSSFKPFSQLQHYFCFTIGWFTAPLYAADFLKSLLDSEAVYDPIREAIYG